MCLIAISSSSLGQLSVVKQTVLKNAHVEAQKMGQKFVDGDYDSFMKFIHPAIMKKSGGLEVMKKMLQTGLGEGTQILSNSIEPPKSLINNDDTTLQCVLDQTMYLIANNVQLKNTSSLIGISYDKGTTWYFINANQEIAALQQMVPELNSKLKIIKNPIPEIVTK
ncbi:MAG: hypothetical protein ACI9J3_003658 [Parvicellaceae bacterium]